MIDVRTFDASSALSVFRHLDQEDWMEAQTTREDGGGYLELYTDWCLAARAVHFLSLVIHNRSGTPFGVLGLANNGAAGVAQAAFLARSHQQFRRELVALARNIQRELPEICEKFGIRRIEARCWAAHRSAPAFLRHCGFRFETELPDYGGRGVSFLQYAHYPQNGATTCVS